MQWNLVEHIFCSEASINANCIALKFTMCVFSLCRKYILYKFWIIKYFYLQLKSGCENQANKQVKIKEVIIIFISVVPPILILIKFSMPFEYQLKFRLTWSLFCSYSPVDIYLLRLVQYQLISHDSICY